MMASAQGEVVPGSVVWVHLSRYPWWPCKVVKEEDSGLITFVSFEDNYSYYQTEFKSSKVRGYNCAELPEMIRKGRQSLRKREATLQSYQTALSEAEAYIQRVLDPHFHLATLQLSPPGKKKVISSPAQGVLTPDPSSALSAHQEAVADQNQSPPSAHSAPASEGKQRKKRKMGERNRERDGIANGVDAGDDVPVNKKPRLSSPVGEKLPLQEQGSQVTAVTEQQQREQRGTPKDETASLASSSDKPREEGSEDQRPALPSDASAEKEAAGKCGEVATPLPDSLRSGSPVHQASPPILTPSHAHTSYYSSLMESSGSELDLDNSSDSSLPSIDLSFKDTVEVFELTPRDVIWAKYKSDPFWPALISSVKTPKKKSNSEAHVYFFGEDQYQGVQPIKLKNRKNIAPFTANQIKEFSKIGAECKKKERFLLALNDAHEFIRGRAEGKYASKNPREVLEEVAAQRLPGVVPQLDWSLLSDREDTPSCHSEEEPGLKLLPSDSSSESDGEGEPAAEIDFSPYTYERVVSEVEALEEVLLGIMSGEVESSHHKTYTTGSMKERNQLKRGAKSGPLKKWPATQLHKLLKTVLCKIARKHKEDKFEMAYAYDVLLPEAMVRVKAKIEGLPLEQAIKQF